MKRLFTFVAVMAILCACSTDEVDDPALHLSQSLFEVPTQGGKYSIEVESNSAWTVETVGQGVECSPTKGKGNAAIEVTVGQNGGGQTTSLVYVRTSGGDFPLTAACEFRRESYPEITATPNTWSTNYLSSSTAVRIVSNKRWKAVAQDEFVKVEPTEGEGDIEVFVTISQNQSESRSTQVVFTTSNQLESTTVAQATIEIAQGAHPVMGFGGEKIDVRCTGGQYKVNFTSNCNWMIESIVSEQSSQPFLTVTPQSASGDTELLLNVEANNSGKARTATITIKDDVDPATTTSFTVVQLPYPALSTDPELIEAPIEGGRFAVKVNSNVKWKISSVPDLVASVEPTEGEGEQTIQITIDKTEGSGSQATMEFATVTGCEDVVCSLAIKQDAATMIAVSPTSSQSTSAQGTFTLDVTSNADWVASTESTDVSIEPSSGTGNTSVKVVVGENRGEQREIKVLFATADGRKNATWTLTQGPVMTMSNNIPAHVTCEGGRYQLVLQTIAPWTLSATSNLTLSQSAGTGNATIDIDVAENQTNKDRTERVTINIYEQSYTLDIEQYRLSIIWGGEAYSIVKMQDGRWWMAENLRYVPEGKSISDNPSDQNGVWYPSSRDQTDADGLLLADKSQAAINQRGLFYNMATILGVKELTPDNYNTLEGTRGICPKGWHIPTLAEAEALIGLRDDGTPIAGSPYYSTDQNGALLTLLNADGFNYHGTGAINFNTTTLIGRYQLVLYGSEITMAMMPTSYAKSITTNDDGSVKNIMYRGMMITHNASFQRVNLANTGYKAGSVARCIKDE